MFIKSIDGTSIYYDSVGFGKPIILLHGLGGDHTVWYDTGWITELSKNNKVVSIDLRGCGKSEKPCLKESYSIEKHIADIELLINKEEIQNPILFGWSLGATIVSHFASKNIIRKAIISGSYFGLIFSDTLITNGSKNTNDPILIERLRAFQEWPIIEPQQMKCPYIVYTGTKDGNVVKELKNQKEKIINNNGHLYIFDELDHFGLLSSIEQVKDTIKEFINS